jgi:hypothetical protein
MSALIGAVITTSASALTQQEELAIKAVACLMAQDVKDRPECIAAVTPTKDKEAVKAQARLCFAISDKEKQADCIGKILDSATETVSTKEAVNAFAPGDYKPVDPKDLMLGPKKFIGKPIELWGMQCFYADINEYRCWSHQATMTVFAPTIIDYPDKDKFDDVCGRQKNAEKPICRRTVHIIPKSADFDQPSAFGRRTIITTDALRFVTDQTKKR